MAINLDGALQEINTLQNEIKMLLNKIEDDKEREKEMTELKRENMLMTKELKEIHAYLKKNYKSA